MGDWWSYRPADFLMFAPHVYWRLFATLNAAAWPLQPAIVAGAFAGLVVLRGPRAQAGERTRPGPAAWRIAFAVTAAGWIVVAWAFLHQRLAPVFPWADAFAWTFAVQAGLLAASASRRAAADATRPGDLRSAVGTALVTWALLGHPWLAWAAGRPWDQAEVFALAPDPTAIGTLGLLLRVPGGTRLRCAACGVPLAWCAFSAAMLWTMGSAQGWVVAAAGVAALLAGARR